MARRHGRKGDYLAADDWTGFTVYGSQLRQDFWGNYTRIPLKRNLQEIASPLNDPQPVPVFRGPQYEAWPYTAFGFIVPLDVGDTNVPTNRTSAAIQALAQNASTSQGIGAMQIGSTFQVF